MTDVERLLLDEMSKLRDGQTAHGVLLGRIDERLEDVEARLPPPSPHAPASGPLTKKATAAWGAAGLLLGGAVAGLLQAWGGP